MNSIEREKESGELEAQYCAMVKENRFLLVMKPAVKALLERTAIYNNWQILSGELKK